MDATYRPCILVVDDDGGLRESMAALLDALGFETRVAGDGKEALQLLGDMSLLPCLILLDLTMPVMGGEEFVQRLAADPRTARIPVVLVSANPDLLEKASSLDVAAALRKPVSLSALNAALERYCVRTDG